MTEAVLQWPIRQAFVVCGLESLWDEVPNG